MKNNLTKWIIYTGESCYSRAKALKLVTLCPLKAHVHNTKCRVIQQAKSKQ